MLTIDRLTLSKISDNASQHFSTAHINLILPHALPHLSSLSLSALSLSSLSLQHRGSSLSSLTARQAPSRFLEDVALDIVAE